MFPVAFGTGTDTHIVSRSIRPYLDKRVGRYLIYSIYSVAFPQVDKSTGVVVG